MKRKAQLMTVKDFLSQYKECEAKIITKQIRIFSLREQVEGISWAFSEGCRAADGTAACIIDKYTNMERDFFHEIIKLRKTQKAVKAAIESVENLRYKTVLERCYIYGMSLSEAATDMGISYQRLCTLHTKALQQVRLPYMEAI